MQSGGTTGIVRTSTVLLVAALVLLVHLNAVWTIAPIFGHFQPRPLGLTEGFLVFVLAVGPSLVLSLELTPAAISVWILYLFVYLGIVLVGVHMLGGLGSYLACVLFYACCLALHGLLASFALPWKHYHVTWTWFHAACVLGCLAVILVVWSYSGFTFRLGLEDLYARRMDARGTIGFGGYFIGPLKILLPVIAIQAWRETRSFVWLGLMVMGIMAVFSLDGTKSTLVFPLVLLLVDWGLDKGRLVTYLLTAVVTVCLLALVEWRFMGTSILADFLVRRIFVAPGLVAAHFWTYQDQFDSLGNITYEVGALFFGDETNNANSNMFAFGLAWGGWIGGFLIAAVSGALVGVFNVFPGERYRGLGVLMATGCALIWAEQFLHTSLLTSGVFMVLVFAWLLDVNRHPFRTMSVGG